MQRSVLLFATGALVACGSRTGLELGDSRVPVTASATCPNVARPWLLFELSGAQAQLYAMRVDGTEGHPLTLAHGGPIFASVSPDGTKLLYVSFDDAGSGDNGNDGTIYLYDSEAATTTPVVTGNMPSYSALSADGTTVVYTLGFDIHVVGVDGTNDRLLIQASADSAWGYGHPILVGSTGTVLYGFGGAFGSIDLDGANNQTLVEERNGGFDYPNPAVSPDLTSVAAVVECGDETQSSLRIYPYASLPASCDSGAQVTSLEGYSSAPNDGAADPAWGPSGLIAYADGADVFVVAPTPGAAPRNMSASLTGAGAAAFDPVWASGCSTW